MKASLRPRVGLAIVVLIVGVSAAIAVDGQRRSLPPPALKGKISLEEAISRRRSVRTFADKSLSLEQIAQLCWAGQGVTDKEGGYRAAPSAGALYPITLYVVTAAGVDRYEPREHALERHVPDDPRRRLQRAALEQESVGNAPACFVIAAEIDKTAHKYERRAERYCLLEAGHVAQNILLQAAALDLAALPVGAFTDKAAAEALKLPDNQSILYLVPVGYAKN